MSEIAGRLAPQAAALPREARRAGVLLAGTPGVQPGHVVALGGGIVGYNAAIIAPGLGARVTVLERSIDRMRQLRRDPLRTRQPAHVVEPRRSSRRSRTPTS
jgi:alanine dehydrogenase